MDDTTEKQSVWERPVDRRTAIKTMLKAGMGAAAVTALPDIAQAKEQQKLIRQRIIDQQILADYGISERGFGDAGLLRQEKDPQAEPINVSELIDGQGARAGFKVEIPTFCLEGGNGLYISFNQAQTPAATRQFEIRELADQVSKEDGASVDNFTIYCLDKDFSGQIVGTATDSDTTEGLLRNVVVAEGSMDNISKATVTVSTRVFRKNEVGDLFVSVEPVRFYAGVFDKNAESRGNTTFDPTSAQG